MKISEIAVIHRRPLTEAKARIDHPEDIIFDENGVQGALRAIDAIEHMAQDPASTTTIKWDGSPAVIFGWVDADTFIVTDKAGIAARTYDGLAKSGDALTAMIYNRKPDQPGRADYAARFGDLYELLKRITPKRPIGRMIQGDLLWMTPADLKDTNGTIEFKPNKVRYQISKDSDLGKQIKRSQAGVVIHGYYPSAATAAKGEVEPKPATPTALKIKSGPGIVVLGPETGVASGSKFKLPKAEIAQVRKTLKGPAAQQIDDMLDPFNIGSMKISNLPDLFKNFINHRARAGEHGLDDAAKGFIAWVKSPASRLTANKQKNVLEHIKKYESAYRALWQIVAGLTHIKHAVKDQLDASVAGKSGQVTPVDGHEGFVAATPHGKIKLVNRPVFMKA